MSKEPKKMKLYLNLLLIVGMLMVMSTFTENSGGAYAGFGCPFDQYRCHQHCQTIGRRGGYCGNSFKTTCICYRN
ncbi:hypothetical protein J437_LFUL010775 [Ladona fulva]|uniref:Invertebrate defensins family profile domain-containing protein n=1 Tax=Ladona fulva TaxID=123851 RepID=A0A8K0P4F6_LADFU|nr:hypothetical protein J437_LFUL010775 [Ladona fulva]